MHDNRRCGFKIGTRRCTAAGTSSAILTNSFKTGQEAYEMSWYCSYHVRNQDQGAKGLQMMDVIDEEHSRRLMDKRSEIEKHIDKFLYDHPELCRTKHDDRYSFLYKQFNAMPGGYFRELAKEIAKRGCE